MTSEARRVDVPADTLRAVHAGERRVIVPVIDNMEVVDSERSIMRPVFRPGMLVRLECSDKNTPAFVAELDRVTKVYRKGDVQNLNNMLGIRLWMKEVK